MARWKPSLNFVIRLNPDISGEAAERAEVKRPRGPLAGLPVLRKDNIEARGMPTTAGSLALADNDPGRDAFLASERYLEALQQLQQAARTAYVYEQATRHATTLEGDGPWNLERRWSEYARDQDPPLAGIVGELAPIPGMVGDSARCEVAKGEQGEGEACQ